MRAISRRVCLLLPLAAAPGCARKLEQPALRLDESHNNGSFAVAVGALIELALPGNPSSGFTWQRVGNRNGTVEREGDVQFRSNSNEAGDPGIYYFRFRALQPGSDAIRMVYARFEKSVGGARTFTVTIEVK
jgi:inhibitor of cysteine peptidase